jgi:hypothetical protein
MRFVNFSGIRVDIDQVIAYQAANGFTTMRLATLPDLVRVEGDVTTVLDSLLEVAEWSRPKDAP